MPIILMIIFFCLPSSAHGDGLDGTLFRARSYNFPNQQQAANETDEHDHDKDHDQDKDRDRDEDHDRDHRPPLHFYNYVYAPVGYATYLSNMASNQNNESTRSTVDHLPAEALRIFINGKEYYYAQKLFYKPAFSGYVLTDPNTVTAGGSFTLEIPTSNGAYTKLQFDPANGGYVGPQGEFYQKFPSIEQLLAMYVK